MYALINQTRVAFVALDRVTLIPFEMADRAIVKAVRRLADRFAPFTVHADWMDGVAEHKAHSRQEALDWCACYPMDAVVLIRNRRGRVISWRG